MCGMILIMKEQIIEFDKFLASNGLKFEAVVIGGAALSVMDIIARKTRDVDLIDPEIPLEIKDASINFANQSSELDPNWLNNGPISIIKSLPRNWRDSLIEIYKGEALVLKTLSRSNLLKTKLFAYCDRQLDEGDCIALSPTEKELVESVKWIVEQDTNKDWPNHVEEMINELKKKL